MNTVNKILRKARRIPAPQQKPIKPANKWKIAAMHQKRWRETVAHVRDRNFQRAQHARALQIEGINAEKARQADISKARLKNLKKARKALAKKRSS